MNWYYIFYCRAYDWYNTNGKKSKDTLRMSAIALITFMPLLNGLTIIVGIVGVLNKHTPGNKWIFVVGYFLLIVINYSLISTKKSDELRNEYAQLDDHKKKKISFYFFLYLTLTAISVLGAMVFIAYYKHKYGNYDAIYLSR